MNNFLIDEELSKVFQAYYQQTNEAVVITELLSAEPLETRFIHVNDQACELLGYSREELKQLDPVSVFFKGLAPELFLSVKKRFASNRTIALNMNMDHSSGSRIQVEANCRLLDCGGRQLIYSTVRIPAEKDSGYSTLLYEKEFAHELIDTVQAFVVLLNSDGTVSGWNSFCSERTGYHFEEIRGEPFWEAASHREAREEMKTFISSGGSGGSQEASWLCKSGESIPIRWFCRKIEDEMRVLTGIDLTENRNFMQKLEESRHLLESVKIRYYDAIACGVTVQDPNGRIVFANEYAAELLGFESSSLLSMDSFSPEWEAIDHTGKPLSGEEHPSMITLRTKEEISHYIMGIYHPVKKRRSWLSIHTKLLYSDRKREVEYIIATFQDVTEKIELDNSIKEQEKLALAGRFAVSVAHEIRNPLTSILGFMKLMESGNELNAEYMRIIKKELEHIQQVTGDFLILANQENTDLELLDLGEDLLQPVLGNLLPDLEARGISIKVSSIEEPLFVHGKKEALHRLFLNFLTNSIEAITETGIISIDLKRTGQQHIITITDTGSGIAPDRLPFLGEPFYSLKEKGTGLGLLICRKILEDHNGSFEVTSSLLIGTSITILLPAAAASGIETA
ncbi:PAS domain S-box protein [Bacillus mangrovi]|uniref:histidine kinase n=1 Tax=Metabacillus mangrovi TaxID=1491830 RepID=A0A7X2S8Q6_9BACI|nr:PAS domain-containing protein [Metabacillus mangrovi]MTH55758.1 PAS domain S-box protein [Metabacillus mangrovi]